MGQLVARVAVQRILEQPPDPAHAPRSQVRRVNCVEQLHQSVVEQVQLLAGPAAVVEANRVEEQRPHRARDIGVRSPGRIDYAPRTKPVGTPSPTAEASARDDVRADTRFEHPGTGVIQDPVWGAR